MTLTLIHSATQRSFEIPQTSGVVLLGKACDEVNPDVDLSGLPNAEIISRRHAHIYIQQDKFYLEDLGSANGTYLNQQRLQPHIHYHLAAGDRIHLGRGETILLTVQAKPTASPATGTMPAQSATSLQASAESPGQVAYDFNAGTVRLVGLGMMAGAVGLLAAHTQVGIWTGLPAVAICIAGAVLLLRDRENSGWGWGLIVVGLGIVVWTGRVFAAVNLLALLLNALLFLLGYQLYSRRPVFNAVLAALQNLFTTKSP